MNEILKKYYNLDIEVNKKYDDGIIFFVNGDYFYLCKCNISEIDLDKCYQLYIQLKQNNIRLHDFVFNIDNNLLSEKYVLLKLNYIIDDIDLYDLKRFEFIVDNDYKEDFYSLWVNKIDYLEKQLLDLSDNNVINYSFDYFLGIAEMLLSFYKDNKSDQMINYVVHKSFGTLSTIDFYNPLNIVIGERYKDVASFIRLTNDWELLYKLLDNIKTSDKVYLFVRLAFPFKYFGLVNSSLVDVAEEEKILVLIQDIEKYEEYLRKLEVLFGINLFYFIKKDN